MRVQRNSKRVFAEDMIDDVEVMDEQGEVSVDPEATDLLFEAEDVAELVAEITGETVEVTVEDDAVEFAVGEDVYTVEAEGDEEILETSRKVLRGKSRVAASRKPASRRRVAASTSRRTAPARSSRTVRRVGRK